MSWFNEILRAFFLSFGAMEFFSNLIFLTRENGLISARKLHQEIPATVTDKQIKHKSQMMFVFGVIFMVIGLLSYVLRKELMLVFQIALGLFSIYAIIEALYYKYWRTFGFALVTIVLCISFWLINYV